MAQVSVAVLLDSFVTARLGSQREREEGLAEERAEGSTMRSALDPLLDRFALLANVHH